MKFAIKAGDDPNALYSYFTKLGIVNHSCAYTLKGQYYYGVFQGDQLVNVDYTHYSSDVRNLKNAGFILVEDVAEIHKFIVNKFTVDPFFFI